MKNLLLLSILIIGLSSCAVKKKQGETTMNTPAKEEMTKPPIATMAESPPPPPLTISPKGDKEAVEGVDFIDMSIDEGTEVDNRKNSPQKEYRIDQSPKDVPSPKVEKQVDEIFRIVEEMPRFPGCEDMQNNSREQKTCAEMKLLQFIQKNIRYPEEAKKEGIQGRCYVTFIVEKDGILKDIKLIRDIGGGCGEEALRVVNEINKQNIIWTPAKQRGRSVRVQFNLPIHFKL